MADEKRLSLKNAPREERAGKMIHQDEDLKWWFWNEDWDIRHGPFESREQAYSELIVYARSLEREGKIPRPGNFGSRSDFLPDT